MIGYSYLKMIIKQICSSVFKGILLFFLCISALPIVAQDLIVKQPEDLNMCYSETFAVLSIEAKGTMQTGFTFRWRKFDDGFFYDIPGPSAGGQDYTISFRDLNIAEFPIELKYQCVVRDNTGQTQTSRTVTLTISDVPSIQKINYQEVCNGDKFTAFVNEIKTNGKDLEEYQWEFGHIKVTGGNVINNSVPPFTYENMDETNGDLELKLTITNSCGSRTIESERLIHVWSTPKLPTSMINEAYCQEVPSFELAIAETNPVWFNDPPGAPLPVAPTVDTKTPGTYSWWVKRQVIYPEVTCESELKKITVEIIPLPPPPKMSNDTVLCLNEPGFTLHATGTDVSSEINWYQEATVNNQLVLQALPGPPTVNPSIAGTHSYFVTQTIRRCESRLKDGMITAEIIRRAETEKINLPDTINICPKSSRVITVSSDVQNPVFKWYTNLNKTGFFQEGTTFETPVLMRDTAYYVTLTYGGLCESSYPKSVSIRARDIELPEIIPPPNLEIETDLGFCYASNVNIGRPTVSDNCTSLENLIVFTDLIDYNHFPDFFLEGDTTLMWWVVDEARNTTRGLQTISVRDREKPKGTCPGDIYIPINDNETSAIVFYELNYTDNCGYVKDSLNLGLPSGSEFPANKETLVRHYLIDKAGNTETCEFKVIVKPPYRKMEVDLRISKNPICPGEQVVITPMINGGSGNYKYSWRNPHYWTEPEMRDYPLVDTSYEITVSDDSTSVTKRAQITVSETRQVILEIAGGRPQDQIFEGDEVLVIATSDFASYKLLLNNEVIQMSGLNSGVSFQAELGTYFVRVFATDFSDCVTQDQLEILVDSKKLPNVFTPNFDGKNDIFLEGFDLEVFSRTGQLLYKGFDGWDGTYQGKTMPEGTYLYVVRRMMNNGELRIFKDYVTLKR